jgi:hypothetical protein
MKYFIQMAVLNVLIFGLSTGDSQAQVIAPYLSRVDYSTNIDYINSEPILIYSNQVIIDTIGSATATQTPETIKNVRNAQVDGHHRDTSGLQYYSFNNDTKVSGFTVLKSDIIRCDPGCTTFVLFFDSDLQNLKDVNINAFTLDPNNDQLIFSIESDARIDGVVYLASDLIRFDGTNFSLEYDSTSDVFSRYKNIDALTFLSNNRYLVSFANESVFHELFEYNLTTHMWATAYTPLSFGDSFGQVNIVSLMAYVKPLVELVFKDGFE